MAAMGLIPKQQPFSDREYSVDRLKSMEIFIGVAEAGSFAGAANLLSIPRSTVTRAIKDLETHLGAALIQRTTRQFSLTEAGMLYLERVRQIVQEIQEAETDISRDTKSPEGVVHVNTTPSIASQLLVPALSSFHAQFPKVKIKISTTDRLVEAVGGGFDCVIRAGEPDDSTSISARKLGDFRWILCGSPQYLEKFGTPLTLEDLSEHCFVGYSGPGPHQLLLQRLSRSWLILDETEGYIAAGLNGFGLIYAADFLLSDHLKKGRLCPLHLEGYTTETSLYLIHGRSSFLPPALRVFRDWAKESLLSTV